MEREGALFEMVDEIFARHVSELQIQKEKISVMM